MQDAITNAKRYLCVKRLTISDGFTCKSVKLPRAEARFFIGELRNRQATPLVLLDEMGAIWELVCTCTGGQYALSRIGAFCEVHGVRPGSYFIFYADHDHIVRLAVRQQLPFDVQAAVVAARAAMAVRNSPQRPPAQQQQAAIPPAAAPVLDDPSALDEMPLRDPLPSSAPRQQEQEVAVVASTPEPPRSKPLGDRSNLPFDRQCGLLNASGNSVKAKAAGGGRIGVIQAGSGTTQSMCVVAVDNKENEPNGTTQRSVNAQAPSSLASATSSGGFSALAGTRSQSQQLPAPPPQPSQQHDAQPRAASPVHTPSPARSPSVQPSPPPATRLRMRFEARVRAQSGKRHHLSVRTGPESPPPMPPGYGRGLGFAWPCGRAVPYSTGNGFLPLHHHWGTAAVSSFHGRAAMAAVYGEGAYEQDSEGMTDGGVDGVCESGSSAQQQPAGAGDGSSTMGDMAFHQQLPSHGSWRQALQCNELLDWEVGRRTQNGAVAQCRQDPAAPHQQQQPARHEHNHHAAHASPPAGWMLHGSAAAHNMNLALIHHLLMQQSHAEQVLADWSAAHMGGSVPMDGAGSSMHQQHSGHWGMAGASSPAGVNPTLQQLLGMSPAALAWELAAMSDTAGAVNLPSAGSRAALPGTLQQRRSDWRGASSMPRPSAMQRSDLGHILPSDARPLLQRQQTGSTAVGSPVQDDMEIDNVENHKLQGQHDQQVSHIAVKGVRTAPEQPADSPSTKRSRATPLSSLTASVATREGNTSSVFPPAPWLPKSPESTAPTAPAAGGPPAAIRKGGGDGMDVDVAVPEDGGAAAPRTTDVAPEFSGPV